MNEILATSELLVRSAAVLAGSIIIGLTLHYIIFRVATKISIRTDTGIDNFIIQYSRGPLRILIPLLLVYLSIPYVKNGLSEYWANFIDKSLIVIFIIGVGWLLTRLTHVLQDVLLQQYSLDVSDNLKARKVHTQTQLIRKILVFIIILLSFAAILMNFEQFRELGTGLLASAGVAGLVIGFAAQKTLANLLAGIQIAVTQPIRLDDVVIVEGEWGRIEEITLTYVVVRIWDLRRLILPISYFLEKPFQNWTRVSANILGTVFLHVDYTVPIDEIRQELGRILEESELFDGEVWRLHTTEAGDRTVELRALMSAPDSPTAWELRCEVREKLVDFVQKNYPDGLPRIRTELGHPADTLAKYFGEEGESQNE